jgi:hypothetical protein
MVRLPGICNFNPETTIAAHGNGAGIARKKIDLISAHCCSACHAVIDGHVKSDLSPEEVKIYHYEGIFRTQELLHSQGLILTPGSR